jgi:hypothetical protein
MSVSGICDICENAPAIDRCERCGAVVCRDHRDAELGYCTACAAEVRAGDPSSGDSGDPPPGEGGDTFQF